MKMSNPTSPISFFSDALLAWFDLHGRHDLPWQSNKTPYRVWVSEIMLQQTQVQTVIPYFQKFMTRFPDIQTLAEASQDEVLAHWSGLGYYARGRNLHKAAKKILSDFNGDFPRTYDEIVSLPGIGRSTAGAILSIAYGVRTPILDGNVKRVLCRYDAVESWSGEKATEARLWQRADALTPADRVADYTQAIMDLGATLCRRSRPLCDQCPVQSECAAKSTGRVSEFPFPKPKKHKSTKHTVLLVALDARRRIFLQKRPQQGIWGGLWSLPQFEDEQALLTLLNGLAAAEGNSEQSSLSSRADLLKLTQFKHTFTHYHLMIEPIILEVESMLNMTGKWMAIHEAAETGLPAPVRKIIQFVEKDYVKNRTLRKNG
ncbi:MAG: A/G-specific adenine glycosylase [Hydrogenovibrio sp.]|nr:A/G-specific adenine glycosylase [Hydrogenovibrio sp.]